MAVSEWHGGTRIETGTVHPDAIALSRLAYIATSDFPLGRSSVRGSPEEKPRASIEEPPRVAYALADVSALGFSAFLTIRIFLRSSPSLFHCHLTFLKSFTASRY